MGTFRDTKYGKRVRGTMLGFAGDEFQSISEFREWFGEEFHPEKSHSITADACSSIRNGDGEKIWAILSDSHVEAVTDNEYYNRRP